MKMDAMNRMGEKAFFDDSDSKDTNKSCENSERPINLKRSRASHKISDKKGHSHGLSLSKLTKTKAFTIKDILGLDEKEKREQRKLTDDVIISPSVTCENSEFFLNPNIF